MSPLAVMWTAVAGSLVPSPGLEREIDILIAATTKPLPTHKIRVTSTATVILSSINCPCLLPLVWQCIFNSVANHRLESFLHSHTHTIVDIYGHFFSTINLQETISRRRASHRQQRHRDALHRQILRFLAKRHLCLQTLRRQTIPFREQV